MGIVSEQLRFFGELNIFEMFTFCLEASLMGGDESWGKKGPLSRTDPPLPWDGVWDGSEACLCAWKQP